MKLKLTTHLNCSPATAWKYVLTPALLHYIAYPLVKFEAVAPSSFPKEWSNGDYLSRLTVFGIIPFSEQTIGIRIDPARQQENSSYELLDDGHSQLIPMWRHFIRIEANANQTLYTDELELRAGFLTPFVWLFALVFYSHRQRRWRKLVRENFVPLTQSKAKDGLHELV
jgi:hypothetical protein